MNLHVTKNDHIWGDPNASIELVEYGDYQCPYCKKAYYILQDAFNQIDNGLKLVFRNFPLSELHANAVHAAIAAEAAGAQGKFWEMNHTIFENQRSLEDFHLMKYAEQIGLDTKRFEKDLSEDIFFQKVDQDYQSGIRLGVEGTPTFFINGELFEGDWMNVSFIHYLQSLVR